MHRIRAAVAIGLTFCVGACTASPAAPDIASADTTPTPALSAAASAPSPSPVISPVPPSVTTVPTAAPTMAPETTLEALLPDFAGGQYLTKQVMAGDEVLTSGDPIFGRLLALVGAAPEDVEAVTATGGDVDLLAIAVRGVSGEDLSAGMLAALNELDGTQVAELEIEGVPMQRVALEDGDGTTLLMRTAGNALVMASGTAQDDVLEDVLATLLDPKLEELLPARLDGHVMTRFSMPAVAIGATGDLCSIVCPGEPHRLAAVLGVPVEEGDLAIAYSEEAEVSVVAFRFPGARTADLIPARQSLFGTGPDPQAAEMTVGGKTVVHQTGDVFGVYGEEEWQYAHDGILYIVRATPAAGVPPIVEAAITALP